ncbi:hypothetical protein E1A91_A01G148600v1 [Gossypium mustelinum]|uniref:Uncharacterized protein n=3 Tax=Gossypium TaxID=3633 RepID=A0A5D3AFI1_GOSMU|nr:hypothetical protein ES288_A01G156700v1 [Gossypium darwinii]TYI43366.1 hypothetical protein ES332_A01G164400v1 [Gossypium tomentosum]TYJ49642.1 hypothetical protein E1A91_A01G148600v1 [Gossypium mustelinum]
MKLQINFFAIIIPLRWGLVLREEKWCPKRKEHSGGGSADGTFDEEVAVNDVTVVVTGDDRLTIGRVRPREGMRLNNRVKYEAKISKRRRKLWLINGVSKKWWTTIHCFSVNLTCVCAFGSV